MAFSLVWLPDVLHDAGLKVAPVPGWETRGRREFDRPLGVLCHHTGGPKLGNLPSLRILRDGRPDLPGPLSQLGLGRDGTYYVIAAGWANHAGKGMWMGLSAGNAHLIGIEAENTGRADDPWPAVQLDAYQRGVAAILKRTGLGAERCAGHKEFAPGRKPDPSFDMHAFRKAVAAILNGSAKPPLLIPSVEPVKGRPTLRRGSAHPSVRMICNALGLMEREAFDAALEAAVRSFQRKHQLVPDGIVGPKCWAALDALPSTLAAG